MQITLNQDEILDALEGYVRNQIQINDDQEIEIDLKAGRGENGYSATLDIRPAKEKKTSKPRAMPKAEKSEPEEKPQPKAKAKQETAEEEPEAEKAKEEKAPAGASIFAKGSDSKKMDPEEVDEVLGSSDQKEETPTKTSIFSKAG